MTATDLPRWDLTDLFPTIGSREYAAAREELGADITRLTALYDEHDVRGGEGRLVDDEAVSAFEAVLDETNEVMERIRLLGSYLNSFVTTDARDDLAQGELSQLQAELSQIARLRSRFDAWVAALGDDELAARSTAAADHAYPLQRSSLRAAHQMSEDEEGLLADLSLTGSTAWTRLYGTFTSQLVVEVDGHGPMPMSRARGLAYDADAGTRQVAYEAELATWEANEVPIVAALNAVKGEAATVNRRRGWGDDLEPALVANGVDRPTLDAMQGAVEAALPDFRRYLRTKARLLGRGDDGGLPLWDLFAPLGDGEARRWDEATGAVTSTFATYSPQLADLAHRAVDERWIDAEPRDGKRAAPSAWASRATAAPVLLNFDGSFRQRADAGPRARPRLPQRQAGASGRRCSASPRWRWPRRPASSARRSWSSPAWPPPATPPSGWPSSTATCSRRCQVVVDIHSRFLFERSFCEARAKRTVSAAEAGRLMLDAQDATYGDGLDSGVRHPYMWAVKPHYYSSAFYNWPYTFGLLFGLGLYARYTEDPNGFRGGYDDLLSSTGLASAADLASRFGIDVHDGAFWASTLRVLQDRIDEFVSLAG